jgi:hypothetical protein
VGRQRPNARHAGHHVLGRSACCAQRGGSEQRG